MREELQQGIQLDYPDCFIPWDITEGGLRRLLPQPCPWQGDFWGQEPGVCWNGIEGTLWFWFGRPDQQGNRRLLSATLAPFEDGRNPHALYGQILNILMAALGPPDCELGDTAAWDECCTLYRFDEFASEEGISVEITLSRIRPLLMPFKKEEDTYWRISAGLPLKDANIPWHITRRRLARLLPGAQAVGQLGLRAPQPVLLWDIPFRLTCIFNKQGKLTGFIAQPDEPATPALYRQILQAFLEVFGRSGRAYAYSPYNIRQGLQNNNLLNQHTWQVGNVKILLTLRFAALPDEYSIQVEMEYPAQTMFTRWEKKQIAIIACVFAIPIIGLTALSLYMGESAFPQFGPGQGISIPQEPGKEAVQDAWKSLEARREQLMKAEGRIDVTASSEGNRYIAWYNFAGELEALEMSIAGEGGQIHYSLVPVEEYISLEVRRETYNAPFDSEEFDPEANEVETGESLFLPLTILPGQDNQDEKSARKYWNRVAAMCADFAAPSPQQLGVAQPGPDIALYPTARELEYEDYEYVYIDAEGNEALDAYHGATDFAEGLAAVYTGKGWQYINTLGQVQFGGQLFAMALPFSGGCAPVQLSINGTVFEGILHMDGILILLPSGLHFTDTFSEGLAPVCGSYGGTKRYGYMDTSGNLVIGFRFAEAGPFCEGRAYVITSEEYTGTLQYINPVGEVVQDFGEGSGDLAASVALPSSNPASCPTALQTAQPPNSISA